LATAARPGYCTACRLGSVMVKLSGSPTGIPEYPAPAAPVAAFRHEELGEYTVVWSKTGVELLALGCPPRGRDGYATNAIPTASGARTLARSRATEATPNDSPPATCSKADCAALMLVPTRLPARALKAYLFKIRDDIVIR
jgi:hypothetical protein